MSYVSMPLELYPWLYKKEIKKFEAINEEAMGDSDRFEVVSIDRRSFWLHKSIMAKRSPIFKVLYFHIVS